MTTTAQVRTVPQGLNRSRGAARLILGHHGEMPGKRGLLGKVTMFGHRSDVFRRKKALCAPSARARATARTRMNLLPHSATPCTLLCTAMSCSALLYPGMSCYTVLRPATRCDSSETSEYCLIASGSCLPLSPTARSHTILVAKAPPRPCRAGVLAKSPVCLLYELPGCTLTPHSPLSCFGALLDREAR